MILSTRAGTRILDYYFDESTAGTVDADIVRYNQSPHAIPNTQVSACATVVVDLSKSEAELLSQLKRHTRDKLRRALKENLTYHVSDGVDPEALRIFADHVDRCLSAKHLPRVSRPRLSILAKQKALDLSWMTDESGEILCASSYLITPKRVRGLYAGAAFRFSGNSNVKTRIGRANRLLYWQDMLRFKSAGFTQFDLGGYYTGVDDPERVRVNGFKDEFGGSVVHEYNCEKAVTLRGKIILWVIQKRRQWYLQKGSHGVRTAQRNEASIPASV